MTEQSEGIGRPSPCGHGTPDRQTGTAESGAEPGSKPVLSVRDVHLSFAGVTALGGVSLQVRPAELFATWLVEIPATRDGRERVSQQVAS